MTDVDLAYTLWISQHLLQPEPSVNEMEEWIYARLSLLTPEANKDVRQRMVELYSLILGFHESFGEKKAREIVGSLEKVTRRREVYYFGR